MQRPRIYSDFNGPYQPDYMLLGYVGTLSDLNRQKIVLREGMEVTVYSDSDEMEDVEMDGIVKFSDIPNSGFPETREWYVQTHPGSLRHIKRVSTMIGPFTIPCFNCGSNIYNRLNEKTCPQCGFEIEYARRRV
jgi:hypothetical protein